MRGILPGLSRVATIPARYSDSQRIISVRGFSKNRDERDPVIREKVRTDSGNFTFDPFLETSETFEREAYPKEECIDDREAAKSKKNNRSPNRKNLFSPGLKAIDSRDIREVLAISVNLHHVTFSRMTVQRKILHWQSMNVELSPRPNLAEFWMNATNICDKINDSDLYLFGATRDETAIKMKTTLATMVYSILRTRREELNCLEVKSYGLDAHYNLRNGNNRMSCQERFMDLINEQRIDVSEERMRIYRNFHNTHKEFIALTTLHCYFFWERYLESWEGDP